LNRQGAKNAKGGSAGRKRLMIFASLKIFSFCREAKFGEFRPTLPAQVVCGSPVGAQRWGEIV
jgi:hypothetical protein